MDHLSDLYRPRRISVRSPPKRGPKAQTCRWLASGDRLALFHASLSHRMLQILRVCGVMEQKAGRRYAKDDKVRQISLAAKMAALVNWWQRNPFHLKVTRHDDGQYSLTVIRKNPDGKTRPRALLAEACRGSGHRRPRRSPAGAAAKGGPRKPPFARRVNLAHVRVEHGDLRGSLAVHRSRKTKRRDLVRHPLLG